LSSAKSCTEIIFTDQQQSGGVGFGLSGSSNYNGGYIHGDTILLQSYPDKRIPMIQSEALSGKCIPHINQE